MSVSRQLYNDNDFPYITDYRPILNSFGKILLQVDDRSYQGDSRVLYQDNERYGYLQFGWGSCCGCDALQACKTYEDVDKLIEELRNSIRWFDSRQEALTFFVNHDWKGDYGWYADEQQQFITEAIQLLQEK